jgi:hypothetical protein
VVFGGSKNDSLLALFNSLSHNVEKDSFFFDSSADEKVDFELFTQFVVFVNRDESVVFNASKGEIFNLRADCSGEKKRLPVVWHAGCDGFELFGETHLE